MPLLRPPCLCPSYSSLHIFPRSLLRIAAAVQRLCLLQHCPFPSPPECPCLCFPIVLSFLGASLTRADGTGFEGPHRPCSPCVSHDMPCAVCVLAEARVAGSSRRRGGAVWRCWHSWVGEAATQGQAGLHHDFDLATVNTMPASVPTRMLRHRGPGGDGRLDTRVLACAAHAACTCRPARLATCCPALPEKVGHCPRHVEGKQANKRQRHLHAMGTSVTGWRLAGWLQVPSHTGPGACCTRQGGGVPSLPSSQRRWPQH